MVAFEVFLNCTLRVTDWPCERPATAGIVMYGVPERLPVAFTSVTLVGIPKHTICNGPLISLPLILVIVTVLLKV